MARNRPGRLEADDLAALLPPAVKDPASSFRLCAALILGVLYLAFILVWKLPRTTTFEAWIIAFAVVGLILKLNSARLSWLIYEVAEDRHTRSFLYYNPDLEKHSTQAQHIEPGDLVSIEKQNDETSTSRIENAIRPRLVLALQTSASGRINLGLMRCQPDPVAPDERYILYKTSSAPNLRYDRKLAGSTAKALTELMRLVPYGEAIKEKVLVDSLTKERRNTDLAVRHALRIAAFVGFITREQSYGHIIEFLKVLSRPRTGGHPSCRIQLTELGFLWIHSATFDPPGSGQLPSIIYQGVNQVGNSYVNQGSVGAMGDKAAIHDSTLNQANYGTYSTNTQLLASELAKLTSTLKNVATDPNHFHALGDLAAAQLAAQKGDGPAATTHLAKLGNATKWILDAATLIAVPVAVAAIKEALHLPG
jgi:hypothetical protein